MGQRPTRRHVLSACGCAGAIGMAGCMRTILEEDPGERREENGQEENGGEEDDPGDNPEQSEETDDTDDTDDPEEEPTDDSADGEMVFKGRTAGWEGVKPSSIAGEQNPTINLQENETYTLTWTNEDGGRHNIELWDSNNEVVADYQTAISDEQGAEQSLRFEAVSEITQYVCEPHAGTMVGEVVVTGDDVDDDFPTDSLTWMIPWSEGGGTDTYARQILPGVEHAIGQLIEVDNRPGANSMVGSEWLATQDPDGYTFGTINSVEAHFFWRSQDLEDQFHIEEDFEPISTAGTFGYTLIVNRDLGQEYGIDDYGSLRDAYQDGDISGFGYQGAGSDSHLTTLVLRDQYGLEYDTAISYDGGTPTAAAVQGGEIAAGLATNTSALAVENSGEAYAVVNLMDVEVTALEAGVDLDMITNYGDSLAWISEFTQTQLAPAGTPEEERQIISEAIEAGVNTDDAQEWAEDTGNILEYGDMDHAEEVWTGIVDEQQQQVEDAIGGFDEFLRLADGG